MPRTTTSRKTPRTKRSKTKRIKRALQPQVQHETLRWHEANRMKRLPLYLFTIIDKLKETARAQGIEIVDLGMGNPDLPPPVNVVQELRKRARAKVNSRYSRSDGEVERKLKEAIATWYYQRFKIRLDPQSEVLPLIGSKEGIAHISLAFLNNDDIALVPNPTYPVHFNGVIMAGGILYHLPLNEKNKFRPDFKALPQEVVRMAKLMILSYPHNPTSAVVDLPFFEEIVVWAKKHDIMILHDFAYSDIVYDGYKPPSFLHVAGAKDIGIEFHTLSKSYSMPGWRIAFAVGNAEILSSLAKTKSYIDFGIFRPVQWAAIEALTGPQDYVKDMAATYKKRRDVFVDGLNSIGWKIKKPKGTFYIWAKIPLKFSALTSLEFSTLLMQESGVVTAPGTGFGEYGEGYVRFALVEDIPKLKLAIKRMAPVLKMKG
jgi:alanine-synthesizing transaminase